ncbi:MAG TPA: hypothetical protein VGH99_01295 [Pseudonocardia sp.]|jgi:hypothetical protein
MAMSKVAAGGLAAATSAVLGSYFGVFGTVGGAAAGSVATALSAELFQRSIEGTGAQLRRIGGGSGSGRSREQPAYAPTTTPGPTSGPAFPRVLIGSLLIFAVGMGVVTGIEWARGKSLSGGTRGTSLVQLLPTDLTSPVGDLLGGSSEPDDPSGERPAQRRSHDLVGGLLSEL